MNTNTDVAEAKPQPLLLDQIGHALRVARHRHKSRAVDAAAYIGVSAETIRRYERGVTEISVTDWFRLATFYGCTFEDMARDGGFDLPRSDRD